MSGPSVCWDWLQYRFLASRLNCDQKIIPPYSPGLNTREIQGHLRELCGVDISPEFVPAVTDAVRNALPINAVEKQEGHPTTGRPLVLLKTP
jgi:sugar (pentulose or hexulose) kinase